MKKTIKQQVIDAKETLTAMTSHSELRDWAKANGMDSASGFSNFKKALPEIGINYDQMKAAASPVVEEKQPASKLHQIADATNGRAWAKNGKYRVYYEGGNNYHYNGSWYAEFSDETCTEFQVKVYLEEGYNNANRAEYVAKYVRMIEDDVKAAQLELSGETSTPMPETEAVIVTPMNTGGDGDDYPVNFYHGCGSYLVAFNGDRMVASVNISPTMGVESYMENRSFKKQLTDAAIAYDSLIYLNASCTVFFARKESDVPAGIETYVYYVPGPHGKHKNIELKFNALPF